MIARAGGALLMGGSYELSPDNVAGDLLCLVAGALYAAYFIIMARVGATIAPLPALALSSLVSIAPLLLFRSEEHTSELQSLMRISYAVFCLKKKKTQNYTHAASTPNQ